MVNNLFDFFNEKGIGQESYKTENEQIRMPNGYDHYYVFDNSLNHKVSIFDKETNHRLSIKTDLPGFHFYVPTYETAIMGIQDDTFKGHCALCIQP